MARRHHHIPSLNEGRFSAASDTQPTAPLTESVDAAKPDHRGGGTSDCRVTHGRGPIKLQSYSQRELQWRQQQQLVPEWQWELRRTDSSPDSYTDTVAISLAREDGDRASRILEFQWLTEPHASNDDILGIPTISHDDSLALPTAITTNADLA